LDKESIAGSIVSKDDIIIDSGDLDDDAVKGKPFLLKSAAEFFPWSRQDFRSVVPTIDSQVSLNSSTENKA
jgi:hypothetical protein